MDPGKVASILDHMRGEWNGRAKKDANFYVAFGRQSQAEDEFLASAADVMPALEEAFSRLPPGPKSERRALEIGCGPGRLMLPMARHFGEVQGVDISEEMVSLARERLSHIPSAHAQVTSGADLSMFADAYFDFVYSYIVFQHIPGREIVLNYLREAQRVLKPGGVLRCQIRGTAPIPSEMERESDTWTGCFFSASEIAEFAREQAFPLTELTGLNTQYMWTTFQKHGSSRAEYDATRVLLKDVTAASGPGRVIPDRGRDAAISLWLDGMPAAGSLADVQVLFGDHRQLGCYLSPVSESGGCQMNARLPDGLMPGEYTVQLVAGKQLFSGTQVVTVRPSGPRCPRVVSVTDGINLTSAYRVETGGAKVVLEDIASPEQCRFAVAGKPVEYLQWECTDPITSTFQFSFHLKPGTPKGRVRLTAEVAGLALDPVQVDVVE
ncbi:MAG: Methyltransferase type 11 [Bryobacterales bacterium]|jgi:SAM-dependent methyltransferase|nr:Methyltransferase type 11 [Bryobacterales bacterium]